MRRREGLEFAVGGGLLLGPLMFALTLPQPSAAPASCDAELPIQAAPTPETIVVEVCERAPEPAPQPQPAPEPAQAPTDELSAFLFVTANGLVLSTEAAPEWGAGRLYEPKGDATYRVAKRAAPTEVPAALWAQRGRSFDLYNRDGKVCSARIGELHVVSQYDGWSLDGVMGDDIWERYEDPADIPRRLWRPALWARAGHWLVADIESDESCEGALWARDAALPAPVILTPMTRETAEGKAQLAAFERSAVLQETRADYQRWYDELSAEGREYEQSWGSIAARYPAKVTSWVDAAARVRLVELDFGADLGGCGDGYPARITKLERVAGDSFEDTEQSPDVDAIFDADLDGEYEYLYVNSGGWSSMTLTSDGEGLDRYLEIDRDFVCPC
ncbi:hypothetical protein DB30_07000 [Enhygromyxa salina]|uniref:Uncharacterized protein n=1 Tax=Enhygromyxa salina TaxID=215803 RepID=A0A0C2CSV8_9BACT|nr:hypothetical protein [Enhygromyxa salina]KIG14251.1 hypothetical protein DB30_07000 [Enhygromyxa salina]